MVDPLHQILSNEGFTWNEPSRIAFKQLKQTLTTPLVLCLLDFSQQFVIECDANGIRIVAILSQHDRPIAYYNEALKGSTLTLSTYKK